MAETASQYCCNVVTQGRSLPCIVDLHESDIAGGEPIATSAPHFTCDLASVKGDPGRGLGLDEFGVEGVLQIGKPRFVTLWETTSIGN